MIFYQYEILHIWSMWNELLIQQWVLKKKTLFSWKL